MAIIKLKEPAFPANFFGKCPASQAFNTYQSEMNRMFNSVFGSGYNTIAAGIFPPVNVYQDQNYFYVIAELPGVQVGDIKIDVQESSLQLEGERKIETEANGYYHRREREFGPFSRKITFEHPIASDLVRAKLNNGLLQITLPKKKDPKSREIPITGK